MGKGRDYENNVVGRLNKYTAQPIQAYPVNDSGSNKGDYPDLLITTPNGNHAIELKKIGTERKYIDSDDMDQLIRCISSTTTAWVGLSYNNRELCMSCVGSAITRSDETNFTPRDVLVSNTPDCFNPRIGRTGTYITDKPDTDGWSSQQAGDKSWRVICDSIGVQRTPETNGE